jgi:hypothetical protein
MTGKDVEELDLMSVLAGEPRSGTVESQIVLFSTKEFLANLTDEPFDESKLSIPDDFEEIESPLTVLQSSSSQGGSGS